MECELCGRETNKIFVVEIEEAILEVCEECAKKGRIVRIKDTKISPKKEKPKIVDFEDELELIENYGAVIREAREKLNMSIEELAKKIGEKDSLLRKIEKEEIVPSDKLVEKLERFLKIRLREKNERIALKKNEERLKLRIADVVEIK